MPTVAKPFRAVRPGEIYPSDIETGEKVEGRLAEVADALGALEEETAAPETKVQTGAPEAKANPPKTSAKPSAKASPGAPKAAD